MAASFALDNSVLPQGGDATGREQFYVGTITFSASYTTGGDTLSFDVSGVQSNAAPVRVEIYEEPTSANVALGYTFVYAKGSTAANGKIQIFSTFGGAFSGSYGTTFANTIVKARAWFPRGQ
jgi:hypothetical protein